MYRIILLKKHIFNYFNFILLNNFIFRLCYQFLPFNLKNVFIYLPSIFALQLKKLIQIIPESVIISLFTIRGRLWLSANNLASNFKTTLV